MLMYEEVKELLAKIHKFNTAADGDLHDAEHDAAMEMRDAALAMAKKAATHEVEDGEKLDIKDLLDDYALGTAVP
jgi:hypothetical protein